MKIEISDETAIELICDMVSANLVGLVQTIADELDRGHVYDETYEKMLDLWNTDSKIAELFMIIGKVVENAREKDDEANKIASLQ